MSHARRKKNAQNSEDSDNDIEQPTKRVALEDCNIARYNQEFVELGLISTGKFGSVYKCMHRLDGGTYAIKKSTKPVTGSINERNLLNKLRMQAVLAKHQHVVHYFSSWVENNHMIIQNEYCNSGSLAEMIEDLQDKNQKMSEPELRQLLLHLVRGLQYIHRMKLVHMDIKPSNIFISREKRLPARNNDSADVGFDEEEITYKIGDLGCVPSVKKLLNVSEVDCRYLPGEIIIGDFTRLPKADIFALGLTVYEAGGGGPLPKEGLDFSEIRNDNLKKLSHYSRDLNKLLKLMTHSKAKMRPSAISLIQHPVLNETHAQLQWELKVEKIKNDILSEEIQEIAKYLKAMESNKTAIDNILNNRRI